MGSTKKPTSTSSKKSAAPKKESNPSKPRSSDSKKADSENKSDASLHKRSRSVLGCYTCRLRRKKCDERHPSCSACINLCVKCEYTRPSWWGTPEERSMQKEKVKNKIRQTKMNEKLVSKRDRARSYSNGSPLFSGYDFNNPTLCEPYDPFAPHLSTRAFMQGPYIHDAYEVDIKTERQMFVNDVPICHESSTSTFNTYTPPYLHATLPEFPEENWLLAQSQPAPFLELDPALYEATNSHSYSFWQTNVPVEERDRPLLNHFLENVLRLIFPILEVHQRGPSRTKAIIHSLETNKSYLHCCLSVAAIHMKTTTALESEDIDHDIMRHRYEAVSELCQALGKDTDHEQILEATLAMIFFHCSVGSVDDYLPDIPWSDHFQAVSNLVDRLDLPGAMLSCSPHMQPPFNMTLTAWIDILGSTMLGKTPQFAHMYREKHLSSSSSGLRELMGCDDRVMYLISEIACLEALRAEGRVDDISVCSHVQALGQQLDFTEPYDRTLELPYSATGGAIRPDQLTKNMTAVFRIAARIYLCSLVPGFDRHQQSNLGLISAFADALQYVPAGPDGYDRSLVWPLLIAGTFSVPSSPLRSVLNERVILMGEHADLGSFGRMWLLLQEVWRLADDPILLAPLDTQSEVPSLEAQPFLKEERSPTPVTGLSGIEPRNQQVHWRDVMQRNGWRFLLI
ncbi:transcriptional regulator family: Fungal Specific TF [Paecilomyces variotii]|nr:transcriptional regulator family: Fungal Specific TF [Paecilomyces variotii]